MALLISMPGRRCKLGLCQASQVYIVPCYGDNKYTVELCLKNMGKGTPLPEKKIVQLEIIIVESKIWSSKRGVLSVYTSFSFKFSQCEFIPGSKVMLLELKKKNMILIKESRLD